MAKTKATKKFEKNHLKDTLKRRRDFSKIKQRHQLNAKKKALRTQQNGELDDAEDANASIANDQNKSKSNAVENMTVDEFFADGYDIAKSMSQSTESKKSTKRKRAQLNDVQEDGTDSSSSEVATVGKSGNASQEHEKELKDLAHKDPEFYKFLQEEDPELLDFAEDSNLAEIDELSSDDEKDTIKPRAKVSKREQDPGNKEVSASLVRKWSRAMNDGNSLRAAREMVLAFRAAAHLNEETEKTYRYTVSDPDVYHELLVSALRDVPTVLSHHLPVKELPNGKVRFSSESKKFRSLTSLLKSHSLSIQHLVENLSDSGTIKMAITSILALLPYLLSFKKLIREITRTIGTIWCDGSQSESTRISAFLVLRRLTTIGDSSIIQNTLKTTYQSLLQGCRSTTIHTVAHINLMKNTSAELWGLPSVSLNSVAYTTAFTFIRALAIHLRSSIKQNANDAYKAVYNWQYVHAIDFWSRVLAAHCDSLREATAGKESPLRPLIYPLVQVTIGAMRLIPQAAYFPLRFHCVRALLRISSTTGTYIPLAAGLYEVLSSAEMRRAARGSTLRPVDFQVSLRASKTYLRTRVYQDGVGEQVVELFSEFFALWAKNIAFPELSLPVVVMLKRWLKAASPYNPRASASSGFQGSSKGKGKDARKFAGQGALGGNRNNKLNSSISLLVQKLEANSAFIEQRRAKVEFSPRDRAGVEGFLKDLEFEKTPLGAFVVGQRKSRQDRNKTMQEARNAEERSKRKNQKVKGNQDGDDSIGEDEDNTSDMNSDNESDEEIEMEDIGSEEDEEMELE